METNESRSGCQSINTFCTKIILVVFGQKIFGWKISLLKRNQKKFLVKNTLGQKTIHVKTRQSIHWTLRDTF